MEAKEPVPRLPLLMVRGYPLMQYFAENYAQVERFQARADDLLISTYTKSGTTWISEVVEMLYFDGNTKKCGRDTIINRVPFIDLAVPGLETGAELAARTPSPRVLKTHLPVQLVPQSFWKKNCKIIYVARNPKDVALSFYKFHFISRIHPDPGTWPEFLANFMAGNVSYGSWYSHVKDWWEKAQTYPNLLYMFYEDMLECFVGGGCRSWASPGTISQNRESTVSCATHVPVLVCGYFSYREAGDNKGSPYFIPIKDPRREIRKIANFLDKDLSVELLEKTVHHTSFEQMKTNSKTNYDDVPPIIVDNNIAPFMRKGIIGDWKNNFTVAQNEKFDQEFKRQMSGTTLYFRTYI